jgi:hypothetical protein
LYSHALDYDYQAVKCIDPQIRLAKRAGKEKKEYKLSMISDESYEKIRTLSEAPIEEVFTDKTYGKVCNVFDFDRCSSFLVIALLESKLKISGSDSCKDFCPHSKYKLPWDLCGDFS